MIASIVSPAARAACHFERLYAHDPWHQRRQMHACLMRLSTQLPPRMKINEDDIIEKFIKGGGSGGQKINKTNSLVQLIHKPTDIHIRCQATRSRSQNRTIGRRMLAERIEELEKGTDSRLAIKIDKLKKRKASSMKKKRRKYRESDQARKSEDAATLASTKANHEETPLAELKHTECESDSESLQAHDQHHPRGLG